jgi:hypothetical protein
MNWPKLNSSSLFGDNGDNGVDKIQRPKRSAVVLLNVHLLFAHLFRLTLDIGSRLTMLVHARGGPLNSRTRPNEGEGKRREGNTLVVCRWGSTYWDFRSNSPDAVECHELREWRNEIIPGKRGTDRSSRVHLCRSARRKRRKERDRQSRVNPLFPRAKTSARSFFFHSHARVCRWSLSE